MSVQAHQMTVHSVNACHLHAGASHCTHVALQEYIRQLGGLLVHQQTSPTAAMQQRLEQLTVETSQLIGVIKPLNTNVYKAVLAGRLDFGGLTGAGVDQGLAGTLAQGLDEAWYSALPVSLLHAPWSAHCPCMCRVLLPLTERALGLAFPSIAISICKPNQYWTLSSCAH